MPAPKCPFQNPLITGEFGCSLANPVTVRNTPQIHCGSETALEVCDRVHEHLKSAGLPAFGMADDLATTPHNIYQKIQYGGLLGLQASLGPSPPDAAGVADVHDLIDTATEGGRRTDEIDYAALVPAMQSRAARRRRDRRR
ncbi:MAG: hypothetical protein LJE91_00630 [Gammaproteobacteria bacterium]|jgi:hypothetical protein|nr:hypothetical protein [Gammaproteobacteria bacterium]